MNDDVLKLYNSLQKYGYNNLGTSEEFGAKVQDSTSRRKLYDSLTRDGFNNLGSFDEFSGRLVTNQQQGKAAPRKALNVSLNPATEQAYKETMAPKQAAPAPKQQAPQQETPAPVAEEEANPFPYSGGLEQEAEDLRAQLADLQADEEFVNEYAARKKALEEQTKTLKNLKGDIRNTGIDLEKYKVESAWLKENAARYQEQAANKARIDEINGRLSELQKPELRKKTEEAREARNEKMRGQSENNSIRFGSGGFASYPKDMSMVDVGNSFAADQLDAMTDQELDKGSKFDAGYKDNPIGTAITQYIAGGINNVDLGSLTAGLSEYTAFKAVRDVAEKNNGLINDAFKKLGYDDAAAGKVISDAEAAWEKLQSVYEQLDPMVTELKEMEATLDALAKSGDADRYRAAYDKYKKRYDEYSELLDENKPLQDAVDKYKELMEAVQDATANGLSDSDRDVLDSFARYIEAKGLSAATESGASKAGAGAEQSLEFMLDFIITRGLGKAGTKAASKIAANSVLKKTLGETGAKIVGRGLADIGTSAVRTSLMFPRNLAAYGEQITSMDRKESGVDEFGRYTFDRTKANAALNTALSQYIEYWSEGFGEYFGAAEQSLFRNATKLAPKTAIGQTLKSYRGSIGKYLDYGKFDGMFNEMLEEVVGSTFNALNGVLSGDRVGDSQAMKEFFAGENLGTLFFSFLPMSAIGAATNMKAYHKMKERYDQGVSVLNPLLENGSVSREELEDLTSRTAEMTPKQLWDKVVEITDKAKEEEKKNGRTLDENFAHGLMGYLEGTFSMNLQRDAWEDSKKVFAAANAYASAYENSAPGFAWDLAQEEQQAKQAALDAGFTEEDLDKDSAILARESSELEEEQPERANILYNYSVAKAQASGNRDRYDEETRAVNERNAEFVRTDIETNGQVVQATLNGTTPVYVTQQDATVNPDGTISTPTEDGVVTYVDENGQKGTAKASAFSNVVSTAAGEYIEKKSADYAAKRNAYYEAAQNTVSLAGQTRALNEKVGHNVIVSDGNGVYQPFMVERMTNGGTNVVLSGDKKALQGIAEAMGIRVPTSGYLEAPISRLYPLLAKEEDGSLSSGLGEKPKQEAAAPAQEAAPAAEQAANLGDLRDQTVQISVGDRVQDAHVIRTDDGKVMFELLDSNGDVTRTAQLPEAEFAQAMQRAQAPVEETVEETPAPAAQEEEVVPKESTIPVDEKTGEKIYDAPGVEVADAIADLYATEGLTEADVDQYIAEEAAKAEAARNPERGDMSPQAWGQAKKEAARVADFWAEMQRAAQQRKAQQETAIEEAVEEATPAEMPAAEQKQAKPRTAPRLEDLIPESDDKIVSRLENWSKRTGVKVRIVNSIDEVSDAKAKRALKKGRRLTGWYLPETKEVEVYLPNMTNTLEADKTFIHEVVAHKGLRGLLGDKAYDELCDRVWNEMMTPEEQQEFLGYNEHLQGSEEFLHRAAADEFIARLSENLDMPDRRSIFEKLVDWIMDKLGLGRDTSGIEEAAAEKVAGMETITRSDLYDLLEDSLKRFEKGRSKLYTESLPAPMQNEMAEKGLVLDGGAVMDEQQNALKQATGYETLNELDSKASPEVGDVRFSESTMPAWAKNYMTYRDAKKHVVQVLENFARDVAVDEVVHGMVPTGVYKYGEKSSGSFAGPLRTNIEYIVTFDMDTSCPRSLQYLEYVRSIEAQIGRPLTQVESIQLIEMMRMYGQMIPCVYCYCENKRQALKQYYTDFMKARHGVINAKTDEEALKAMYGHQTTAEAQESTDPAVALTPAAYEVFKKWRQEKDYNPTMQQLWAQYRNDRNVILTILDDMLDKGTLATDMTDQKITNVLCKDLGITGTEAKGAVGDIVSEWKWDRIEDRQHNDFTRVENEDDLVLDNRTLALWREMTSYGKSASGAKNVLRYVPYTDELKTLSQEQRDYINGLGGLRMHSSNDFRIDYVLDYFQFMADMAVNKMLGHTYTKSPEFVRIFGNSGYKINMSVAAYEDSHGIRPNPDEGFDWETAKELREKFPNAGAMLMATSDAQIQFALDNDWIDMCIPFHHSGLPKAVWYQMRHWSDYSSTQNEKFLNATEMRQALKADGVPVSNKLTAAAVEKMYNKHFNIKVLKGKDGKRMRPHFLPGPTPKDGVIIPGHYNDYETYMRLCREYGVHPRFYGIKVKDNTPEGGGREVDITEHPGYMKFIKETARTDSPQTPIDFNFDQPSEALGGMSPIQYALSELQARAQAESEAAGGPVRNIYESYKQDPYGIVPQFINDIIKHKQELGIAELPLDYLTPDSRKWFMTERKALEDAYKDFDTIPYHPHEYDENGNLIMEGEPRPTEPTDEGGTRFREVTDQAKIDELEAGDKVTVYRSMQFVPDPNGDVKYDLGDGNGEQTGFLYAPMSAKVDGKWRNPIRLGRWEEAEERPDLADENGEFILDKGDGSGPMPVAYAPYLHTRRSPLNEQFSSAYNRPNLVIVRSEIPKSELESNYTAEKSKKSTGEHDWPSGKVSNYLAKRGKDTRKVILSRWAKPVEIVPIEQVADEITNLIGDENVAFPYNVVTPGLRAALMKRGVKFDGWQGNKPKNVDELIAGMKGEKEASVVDIKSPRTPLRRDDVINKIPAGGALYPNDDQQRDIRVTRTALRHSLPHPDEARIKAAANIGRVIKNAIKLGDLPVDPDEIGKTDNVSVFYCPVRIDDKLYSARLVVKKYIDQKGDVLDEMAMYDMNLHKRKADSSVSSVAGEPGAYIDESASAHKVKDLIFDTQEADKKIAGVSTTFFREANQNQLGFVSNAEAALDRIRMDKATPEQWQKMLEKEGGMKSGEDKWLGLSDWLASQDRKSTTKQEIADYIGEHRIQIEETNYSEAAPPIDGEYPGFTTAFDITGGLFGSYYRAYVRDADAAIALYNENNDNKIARDVDGTLHPDDRDALEEWGEKQLAKYHTINSTRLGYTTSGLDNKREIALTVPTIEPWNRNDTIHFGDAGEGRAVAWVRFGETIAPTEEEDAAYHAYVEANDALDAFFDSMQEKYGEGWDEKLTEDEKSELARLREAADDAFNRTTSEFPNRVLVIDEIQSKRHQEGREKGYKGNENVAELEEKWRAADNAYSDYIEELKKKYGSLLGMKGRLTPEENEKAQRLSNESVEAAAAVDRAEGGIPAAPFEKNWHELAMKRMLRLAAEEGYDYVAWTTGDQQADRYRLSDKLDSILVHVGDKGNRKVTIKPKGSWGSPLYYTVDSEGNIVDYSGPNRFDNGASTLADVVGKDMAGKIMSAENGEEISGEGLRIGGEGMRGFYDDILPRFMNKYGKKWGIKVEDKELPYLNEGEGDVIMHAIPVTPEMKESVMSGQTMFREARTAATAQVGYEDEIRTKTAQFLLEWQDQDIPVRIAINQVMNEVGMTELPEDCDYLTRHNLVSSRADAQMHNYKLFYFEPMMQTIGQIEDILAGGKPSFFDRFTGRRQKRVEAYNKIVDYCYAVSGLERNEWMRREKGEDRDYSGITDLMGRPKEEWREAEDDARAMIAAFQSQVGNNDLINEMWDRIRACTDFNLEHAYKYGLLSRAEYERLHGTESQPRMWQYYIPLRGFAERTAEDEYAYSMFTNDTSGGDVVKAAKGRTTKADDPFATMRHISELEISQGLQNWAKQALYNFVLNAGENTLLTQVEPWYVKEPGTDKWTVAEPNEGETLEDFEARMQTAQANGDARRGRNGLKLGLLMANKMHRNQHMVRLKINGAEKMIWVNGDPILAQSVNGVKGWNSKVLNGVRTVNRSLSQFYTTYSLKFLTKNKLRDTQFSRIAALVDEPQAYLRQLEKNWWANNGYVAFGYPMAKLVSAWESGELEKKENRTEREQMFIDFMYDGGATGYTMINSMDKIKRELERMVKNAGHGERNIPIIDWYAKGVSALNEASELLTRFTFYQTSRMMGRSRERSALDAKESSVNFNRRGLRSGNGVAGWTSAAAGALYLFINPAIQGLDKFVRLHKSHPWRMGLVDGTYFMMGFVNSLLNAMIAGASDGGDGDDDEKMGPDWYWNIPEWVRRSNMIIGSPFKKLGKWGYLVLALPIEYKGFYAMGEMVSALVQGKYAAKDAPTIANEVIGVVSELLPVNPVEGYTPGDNPAMSVVRNMMPDALAPIMDVATNRSFAGIPLWKENIYDEAQPLSQSAFASTPEILNKAVIKLAEVTSDKPWHVDIPSGAIRGLLKGYGGGAYTFVEDLGKVVFADDQHPRRYENIPFISGFTGYLEEDRRDSFDSDALQRYKELSEDVVKRIRSAAPGEDIKAATVYDHPEDLPQRARVTKLLNSDEYILGEMYYHGMKEKSGAKEQKTDKNGRTRMVDVKDDVANLRKAWKTAKDEYLELAKDKNVSDADKDAAEKKVQEAWLKYTQAEGSLVDRLMEEEYNHVQQKIKNGIPYEPKESLAEKAYKLTNKR